MRRPNRRPNYTKTEDIENYEIPPDYLVYKDDAVTVAVDGDTGEEIARNTNPSTPIQAALDGAQAIAAGGRVHIKSGVYDLDKQLNIETGESIVLTGNGSSFGTGHNCGTVLKRGTGFDGSHGTLYSLINVSLSNFFQMRGIALDAYAGTGTIWRGLLLTTRDSIIHDCSFYGVFAHKALYCSAGDAWIYNNLFEHNGGEGAINKTGDSSWICNNVFAHNSTDILIEAAGQHYIVGNRTYQPTTWMKFTGSLSTTIIRDNQLLDVGTDCFNIPATGVLTDVVIDGNFVTGTPTNFMTEVGGPTINSLYIRNNFGLDSAATVFNGVTMTNVVVRNNDGYKTENTGTATILNTGTDIIVAHGLAATPTVINVTGQHAEVSDLNVGTIGAANFTITAIGGAVSADRDIFWEAKVR